MTMPHIRPLRALALTLILALSCAAPASAQSNLFAPVVQVNDRVITQYEVNQRALFYQILRAPGDSEELAYDKLIDERLQLDAAELIGIEVTDDQVAEGIAEFAGRNNLETEQFIAALAREGVDVETVNDFVRAGIAWRGVVQARFGPRAQVTEDEIDRAIELSTAAGGVRVLLSEIFLAAQTPDALRAAERRAQEISEITTLPAFAAAARNYSAAPSRARGGRQDWIPISNLPPALRAQILTLAVGEVTDPIPVPNAIALFQLRGLEETGVPESQAVAVEFARLFIPGGRTRSTLAEAEKIANQVDTCDDLYGVARKMPEERLLRDVLPVEEIAGDIAIELAKLDDNEISTALTTGDGQALVFLMLCGRTLELGEDVNRDAIRQGLINQRLASYGDGYLSELRADANITRP